MYMYIYIYTCVFAIRSLVYRFATEMTLSYINKFASLQQQQITKSMNTAQTDWVLMHRSSVTVHKPLIKKLSVTSN